MCVVLMGLAGMRCAGWVQSARAAWVGRGCWGGGRRRCDVDAVLCWFGVGAGRLCWLGLVGSRCAGLVAGGPELLGETAKLA